VLRDSNRTLQGQGIVLLEEHVRVHTSVSRCALRRQKISPFHAQNFIISPTKVFLDMKECPRSTNTQSLCTGIQCELTLLPHSHKTACSQLSTSRPRFGQVQLFSRYFPIMHTSNTVHARSDNNI
jgi:hypothetical protein